MPPSSVDFASTAAPMAGCVRASRSARAFGSLAVSVEIGRSTWSTSLFFDSNTNTYLLPLKADIRRQEHIDEGDTVTVRLAVKD